MNLRSVNRLQLDLLKQDESNHDAPPEKSIGENHFGSPLPSIDMESSKRNIEGDDAKAAERAEVDCNTAESISSESDLPPYKRDQEFRKVFLSLSELEQHRHLFKKRDMKSYEVNAKKMKPFYECPICKFLFTNLGIICHYKLHYGSSYCKFCKNVFNSVELLTTHDSCKLNYEGKDMSIRCDICNKTFDNALQLKNHKHIHNNNKECKLCKKTFRSTGSLKYHNIAFHNAPTNFICHICHKGFGTKDHLRRHLNTHNATKIDIYKETVDSDSAQRIITNKNNKYAVEDIQIFPSNSKTDGKTRKKRFKNRVDSKSKTSNNSYLRYTLRRNILKKKFSQSGEGFTLTHRNTQNKDVIVVNDVNEAAIEKSNKSPMQNKYCKKTRQRETIEHFSPPINLFRCPYKDHESCAKPYRSYFLYENHIKLFHYF